MIKKNYYFLTLCLFYNGFSIAQINKSRSDSMTISVDEAYKDAKIHYSGKGAGVITLLSSSIFSPIGGLVVGGICYSKAPKLENLNIDKSKFSDETYLIIYQRTAYAKKKRKVMRIRG